MITNKKIVHPFPPIYDEESRVLILGSFPSVVSRKQIFYYAHPQNRFWKVMSTLYDEEITDRVEFLHKHHIALWDVISSCVIHGSSDQSITDVTFNDISKILNNSKVTCIFTTGGKAGSLYEKNIKNNLPHVKLPSTSSANARMRIEDLVHVYSILKEFTDEKD